jgi:hypothetical protein
MGPKADASGTIDAEHAFSESIPTRFCKDDRSDLSQQSPVRCLVRTHIELFSHAFQHSSALSPTFIEVLVQIRHILGR